MALTRGYVQRSATTPLDTRLMWMGLVQKNLDNSPRTGLLFGDINPIKPTTAMRITLGGGTTFVVSRSTNDGVTVLVNADDMTLDLDAAPSSNRRYDVIWIRQNDEDLGDSDSLPTLGKTTGAAAASPAIPTAPSGALVIATVLVPANVASTSDTGVVINNIVQGTALHGGAIRYRSVTDMNADASKVIDGTLGYIKTGQLSYLRNAKWLRVDGDTFVVVECTGSVASGSTPNTLGSNVSRYSSTDTNFFPSRSDGVIGPLPFSGWYEVMGGAEWQSNPNGERYITITQNDSDLTPAIASRMFAVGTSAMSAAGLMFCNSGDFIKLKGRQSSGSTLSYSSRLTARLIRLS